MERRGHIASLDRIVGSHGARWTIAAVVERRPVTPVALPGAHDSAPDDWAQSPAFAHRHLKAVRSRQPPRRWLPLRGEKGQQVGGFGRYLKNVGIGTMIATMLPYSLAFLVAWSGLLILWIVLNLPMGPGSGLFLPKP